MVLLMMSRHVMLDIIQFLCIVMLASTLGPVVK